MSSETETDLARFTAAAIERLRVEDPELYSILDNEYSGHGFLQLIDWRPVYPAQKPSPGAARENRPQPRIPVRQWQGLGGRILGARKKVNPVPYRSDS